MSKEMEILMVAFMGAKEIARQVMWVALILFIPSVIAGLIPWAIVLLLK